MNKQNNKLALSVIAALTTGIGLIYTLILYHNILFAVAGMSVLFLITAFILTQNLIAFSTMNNKSTNVHIKEYLDDISTQLEAINGSQSQIGKATYLYTKQTAEVITRLEDNYAESQMTLYKNLSSLSNLQNKATKLIIKYDQSNTTKLISTIKDLRNQLSETLIQGFDQVQPNNAEIISVLEDIVTYLKSQPDGINETMGIQLNNIAHELQNVSSSIKQVQIQMPERQVLEESEEPILSPNIDVDIPVDEPEEAILSPDMDVDIPADEPEETISSYASMPAEDENDALDQITAELLDTEDVASLENDSSSVSLPLDKNPNDMLSPDEIAALFAATEPAPAKKEENASFTPTFTVVGKSEPEEDMSLETNIPTDINTLDEDPNKQLSPDEIAALFAAADPAPKREPSESTQASPVNPPADSNKNLSPDEIAALFASLG